MIQALLGGIARVATGAIRGVVAGGRAIGKAAAESGKKIASNVGKGVVKGANKAAKNIKNKIEDVKDNIDENNIKKQDDQVDAVKQNLEDDSSDEINNESVDATKVESQQANINSKTEILNSILNETKKLSDSLKSYENFLYQKEQSEEAAQAEKYVEGADKRIKAGEDGEKSKSNLKKKPKEGSGFIGQIIKIIVVGLFAFLPTLLAAAKKGIEFIKSFSTNIQESFNNVIKAIKQTLNEYVIDPIKTFFTKTIPIAWHNIMFTIQDAIETMIDVPKNALNSLLQIGDEIVINAIDGIVNFIKDHQTLINTLTFGKATAIVKGLEDQSAKRKEHKQNLQKEREKREEERKLARQERESEDVRAYTKEQQDVRDKARAPVAVPEKGGAKPSSNGKFSDPDAFAKALFPYAKYVSESLGGKVPPIAFLGQWAGESGSGRALPADFNYAGIKAFGSFKKGDYVLTEERYTDAEIKRAQQSGETLHRVLDRDTKMDKGKYGKVTVDQFYGKGSFDAAEKAGKHWVQVKSYFAKFDDLQDFADGYIKVLKNPRYKKALESGSAAEFGLQVAQAGYATNNAQKYSQHISSYEKEYGSKLAGESAGTMIASADTGSQIDKASMGAKIEAPESAPTVVVAQTPQSTPQVTSAETNKGAASTPPNAQLAQNLYLTHLATARS